MSSYVHDDVADWTDEDRAVLDRLFHRTDSVNDALVICCRMMDGDTDDYRAMQDCRFEADMELTRKNMREVNGYKLAGLKTCWI